MCVDRESLQLLADGELQGPALYLLHQHVAGCPACRAMLLAIQEERQWFHSVLGREDDGQVDESAAALTRVDAALRRRGRHEAGGWLRWLRLAAALAVPVLAVLLLTQGARPAVDVAAAPGVILDAATVRENAWMYQPAKVLHWTVDSDITGHPTLPDGHYRTLHWVSNIAGAEGSVLRKYTDAGDLVFAVSRGHDGSELVYRRDSQAELVLYPPASVLRAQLESLPAAERSRVERFLELRSADDGLAARRSRFTDWFLASTSARRNGVMQRVRTDDGGEAFYIRTESAPANLEGVKRLVMETYIDAAAYRRYRQRSTRERLDGSYQIEEARWAGFAEVSKDEFDRHTLDDLRRQIPALVMTAARIARRDTERP